jgi:hypothetical protein
VKQKAATVTVKRGLTIECVLWTPSLDSTLDSLCGASERTHRHLDDGERLCRSLLVKVPVPSDEFIVGKKWKPPEGHVNSGQLLDS